MQVKGGGMAKSKLVVGILAVAIGVLAGSTGVANAQSPGGTPNPPATTADCKNGGWRTHTDEKDMSFKNQGQCVKWVNQHGYGGNDGINVGVVTNVQGNNNVITNIINFFVGGNANVNLGVSADVDGNRNVVNNVIRFIFG